MPTFSPPLPRLKTLAAMLLAACLACPLAAQASGGGGDHGGGGHEAGEGGEGKPQAADPRSVAIPVLIAPVVDGGRLVGYIYLGLKVTANEENAADRMRDQLPLLQDQILRAFNNAPIPAAEADSDEAKAALVKTATAALAGLKEAEGVTAIELTDAQNVPF